MQTSFQRLGLGILTAMICLGVVAAVPGQATAQTKFPMVTFSFPAIANVTVDVILAKGIDKANGFQVEPVLYGTGGAMWAGIAKGEVFAHTIGPYQVQKMRSEGVPVAIYGSFEGMASLQVITKNPDLKKFADLKGRSFAATTAFTEFDYMEIYAKRLGFDLRKDVQIIDATTATAQAQLAADRVDAMMAWEPSATMILQSVPNARVVVSGDEAWSFVTGHPGWELLLFVNTDYVKANPGIVPRLLKVYQDAGAFMTNNPDETDAIVSSNKYVSRNVPPGTIAAALKAKRLVIDVRPAWEPDTNAQIWQMMQLGFDDGHMPAMPSKEAVIGVDSPK